MCAIGGTILGFEYFDLEEKLKNSDVEKNDSSKNNTSLESIKDYEYVGLSFSGLKLIDWPKDELGEGEVKKVQYVASIPKILIETETTKKINKKKLEDNKKSIEIINGTFTLELMDKVTDMQVYYKYSILENILIIKIETDALNHIGSAYDSNLFYYYDIKNDKELTSDEVCNILYMTLDGLNDKFFFEIENPLVS